MRIFIFTLLMAGCALSLWAQPKTQNLVIVTLDGMRWQEVFSGVDSVLIDNRKFTHDRNGLKKIYWNASGEVRRKTLFPFLWTTIAEQGQLYGNRQLGSEVNVANPYKFSYPGYNELLTGFPDPEINYNAKVLNPNTNVLEYINHQPEFEGKVAAFSSWDVFPYIVNKERCGFYVNGDEPLKFDNPQMAMLNDMQKFCSRPLDVRPDVLTYFAAREYMKVYRPRVLYIGFDETDDYAHAGMYDQYIKSAHAEDSMLADLWSWIQQTPGYADHTTMVITCDHGRGDKNKDEWTSHTDEIPEAGEIWIAVIGPDIFEKGEMQSTPVLEQGQLAATFASLLGLTFQAEHPVKPGISSMLGPVR